MAVEPGEWIGPALGLDSAAELAAAMGRWSASEPRSLSALAATESADSEVIRAMFARFPEGRSRE
jgi:hypothetical protein